MRTTCLCLLYSLFVGCGVLGVQTSQKSVLFKTVSFHVFVAQTPTELEQGLMHRSSLEQNAGMLFIFPDSQVRTFWMRNTLIALDMIFMDSQKKIVGIIYHATPQSLESRSVNVPSQYVLEINAGMAQKSNLQIGTQATWSF